MAISFKTCSMPLSLEEQAAVPADESGKVSSRLAKTNQKLETSMKAIDRKERKSWQKSMLRNTMI